MKTTNFKIFAVTGIAVAASLMQASPAQAFMGKNSVRGEGTNRAYNGNRVLVMTEAGPVTAKVKNAHGSTYDLEYGGMSNKSYAKDKVVDDEFQANRVVSEYTGDDGRKLHPGDDITVQVGNQVEYATVKYVSASGDIELKHDVPGTHNRFLENGMNSGSVSVLLSKKGNCASKSDGQRVCIGSNTVYARDEDGDEHKYDVNKIQLQHGGRIMVLIQRDKLFHSGDKRWVDINTLTETGYAVGVAARDPNAILNQDPNAVPSTGQTGETGKKQASLDNPEQGGGKCSNRNDTPVKEVPAAPAPGADIGTGGDQYNGGKGSKAMSPKSQS